MGDHELSNLILSQRTAAEIDQRIAKVLSDLDDPEPPLDLDSVRELLRLDRQFYSSSDDGILNETIHRLQIGLRQVLAHPSRIFTAIRTRKLRALWVPERRRVLIDSSIPAKQRWAEAHEITHSLVPHHQVLTLGDPDYTLAPACHDQIEAEANYGAGRLLFLRNRFIDELLSSPVAFNRVRELSKVYKNTMTSTLWRTVETLDVPAIGIVSIHPWDLAAAGSLPVRHFVRSLRFAEEFANVTEDELFRKLARVVHRRGGGPLGQDEVVLQNANGDEHVFAFECFGNTHDTLSLGLYRSPKAAVIAVPGMVR
jgi:hypothetical protein